MRHAETPRGSTEMQDTDLVMRFETKVLEFLEMNVHEILKCSKICIRFLWKTFRTLPDTFRYFRPTAPFCISPWQYYGKREKVLCVKTCQINFPISHLDTLLEFAVK